MNECKESIKMLSIYKTSSTNKTPTQKTISFPFISNSHLDITKDNLILNKINTF
jgi:hypothetical protein